MAALRFAPLETWNRRLSGTQCCFGATSPAIRFLRSNPATKRDAAARSASVAPLARHGGIAGTSLEIGELLLGVANERFRRGGARLPRRTLAFAGGRLGVRARLGQDGFGSIDL